MIDLQDTPRYPHFENLHMRVSGYILFCGRVQALSSQSPCYIGSVRRRSGVSRPQSQESLPCHVPSGLRECPRESSDWLLKRHQIGSDSRRFGKRKENGSSLQIWGSTDNGQICQGHKKGFGVSAPNRRLGRIEEQPRWTLEYLFFSSYYFYNEANLRRAPVSEELPPKITTRDSWGEKRDYR